MGSKPNIVLITFDSGRPDHLSFNGYKKNSTPFLDSLVQKSVYFKNAFATGPGSSVSFVGMFTSTYPLDYGGYSFIDRPRVLFSEALQDAGYTTIGVHSSPYLSGYFGYNRGWDTFLYLNYFKSSADTASPMSPGFRKDTTKAKILKRTSATHRWLEENLPLLAPLYKAVEKILLFVRKIIKDIIHFRPAFFIGEKINAEAMKALGETQGRPLFLWVHYLDAHAPYGLFGKTGHGLVQKLKYYLSDWVAFLLADFNSLHKFFMPLHESVYDDSLRYVDESIKNLFELLKTRGVLNEDTVVIVNADHGEDFLEHGGFGHLQRLFNVNVKVPLIIYAPGKIKEQETITRPVSLIDLAPTVLDFAGAVKPDSFKGKNLFEEDGRDVVIEASESAGDLTNFDFTGIAIIRNGFKLIHWKKNKYLFSMEDASEEKNLYDEKRDVVRDLEARIPNYAPKK